MQNARSALRQQLLRHADRLSPALDELDALWRGARAGLAATGEELFRAREAAAMVAHSRWMYHAALAAYRIPGHAPRIDFPDQDPAQRHRLITGGLDDVWTRPEPRWRADREQAARMIEVVDGDTCITCDRCIEVCPTHVFDRGADGIPVIARHDDCQTCFHVRGLLPRRRAVRRAAGSSRAGELAIPG